MIPGALSHRNQLLEHKLQLPASQQAGGAPGCLLTGGPSVSTSGVNN